MKPYFPILVLTLVVGIIMAALHHFQALGAYPGFAWLSYAFCSLLTLLVAGLTQLSYSMSNAGKSVVFMLGAIGLRFFFSLLFIITYIFLAKPTNARFILPFFVLYALYSGVETYFMAKKR